MTQEENRCNNVSLGDLPPPPEGKIGWPWDVESVPVPGSMPDESPWPKISIVTPSYNQGEFLEETIRSVLLQNYPNLEYIVIDGGSTDNSLDIIRKYEKHMSCWVSEKDEGQADAINKGLSMSTGEIVAWLNSDDFYEKDILTTVASEISVGKNKFIVVGDIWAVDRSGTIMRKWHTRAPTLLSLIFQYRAYLVRGLVFMPNQPAVFWHRQVLEEIGLLRKELYYAMDYEYWLRMLSHEYRFYKMDHVLANYRFHERAKSAHGWKPFSSSWKKIGREYFLQLPKQQRIKAVFYWWCIMLPMSLVSLPYRALSYFCGIKRG